MGRPALCSPHEDFNPRGVGSCARGGTGVLALQNSTSEWNGFKVNGPETLAFQAIHSNMRGDTEPPIWLSVPIPDFSVGSNSGECADPGDP